MIGGHLGAIEGEIARSGDYARSILSAGEANARQSGAANSNHRVSLEEASMPWKDMMQGLVPGNHGVKADCARTWLVPQRQCRCCGKGALLVGATGGSLGALEGGDHETYTLPSTQQGVPRRQIFKVIEYPQSALAR